MPWVEDDEKEQGQKYLAPSTGVGGWVEDTVPFEKSKSNYAPTKDSWIYTKPPDPTEILKNAPESILKLGLDFAGMMGNIPGTMKSLGRSLAGGIEKAVGKGTGEHIPEWDALVKGLKDRYGSIGNLYRTIETDPAGFAVDVSTVAGGAGSLAKSAKLAKLSRATNILYGAGKGVGKVLGEAENYAAGILSGGSPWEMRMAKKPSPVFTDYLRGVKDAESVYKEVDLGLKSLKSKAQAEFGNALDVMNEQGAIVDVAPIYGKFETLLKEKGIIRNPDGTFKFTSTPYEAQPSAQNFIKSINSVLYNEERAIGGTPYQFITPKEAHVLKETIGNLVNSLPEDSVYAQGLGKTLAKTTTENLKSQVPGYAEANQKYAAMYDFDDKMRAALGMKSDRPNIETVESKVKGAASRSYRRDLFSKYKEKTGFDLPAAVAGMDLSGAYPRGLWARGIITYLLGQSTIDPKFLAAVPYAVPRVSGELLQAQGRIGSNIGKVLKKTGGLTGIEPTQIPNLLYQAGQVEQRPKSVLYGGD